MPQSIPRLLAWLNVRPGEERSVAIMLAHAFSMGLATTFFETAASALFLARFSPAALPSIYIAAAIVTTLTGLAYKWGERRASFDRLMLATILFLLLSMTGLRLGLAWSAAGVLIFALPVFYRILSILTDLEYWAVAARLYDVRQAKRLFGVIGSGEVLARIAGSFAIVPLVTWAGVHNLIVLSGVAMIACLILLIAALRLTRVGDTPGRGHAPAGVGAASRTPFFTLMRRPYVALVLAVALLAVLGKYYVDFAFLAEMRRRYTDVQHLATFFGLFSGITQTASLLARVFLSGRILGRFGVRAGLLILPCMHVVCTVLLLGDNLGAGGLVFWLVIMNQGLYKILKHPIDNPSFKVLYQPLARVDRLSTQITVETLVTPLTLGLSGLVMLLFSTVVTYHPATFAWVLLPTFALWALAAWRAGRAYPRALSEALRSRLSEEGQLAFDDGASRAVLREALRSGDSATVHSALDLMEHDAEADLTGDLLALLDYPAPDVRVTALDRLARHKAPRIAVAVRKRLAQESDAAVQGAAVHTLCLLEGQAAFPLAAFYFDDPAPIVRRGALLGLLAFPDNAFGLARLAEMTAAPRAAERRLAAEVIGAVRIESTTEMLARLLADSDRSVRRAALRAAGQLRAASLWPQVIAALDDPWLASAASSALWAGAATTLAALLAALDRARSPAAARPLLRALGGFRSPAALQALFDRLDSPDEGARDEILLALQRAGFRAESQHAELCETRLKSEAQDAVWALAAMADIGADEDVLPLHQALISEMKSARARVLALLSLIYDARVIARATAHLDHEAKEKRAYALELLDVTLAREHAAFVVPLCEDNRADVRRERLLALFPCAALGREARLREILARTRRDTREHTLACAALIAARLRLGSLAPALEGMLAGDSSPLLRETVRSALDQLARPAGQSVGDKPMLLIEKVLLLKGVEMFGATSEDLLAEVAAVLVEVPVRAGATVIEKGEAGDSLFVVARGEVRVHDGQRTLSILRERSIFGELALLDPEPRVASVTATVDTLLLRLERDAFSELMAAHIEIVRGVLSVLCARLRRANESLPKAN